MFIALACLGPARATGQAVAEAQVFGVATFARDDLVAAGLGAAVRPGGRLAVALDAALGRVAGGVGLRAEGLVRFHLTPFRRRGWGVYGGGGAAILVHDGTSAEYLVVLVGAESRPAGRAGWFGEIGVGGGVRLAFGFKIRRALARR